MPRREIRKEGNNIYISIYRYTDMSVCLTMSRIDLTICIAPVKGSTLPGGAPFFKKHLARSEREVEEGERKK